MLVWSCSSRSMIIHAPFGDFLLDKGRSKNLYYPLKFLWCTLKLLYADTSHDRVSQSPSSTKTNKYDARVILIMPNVNKEKGSCTNLDSCCTNVKITILFKKKRVDNTVVRPTDSLRHVKKRVDARTIVQHYSADRHICQRFNSPDCPLDALPPHPWVSNRLP